MQDTPSVRVNHKEYLYFNKAATIYLSPPCYVNIAFEDEENLLYIFLNNEEGIVKVDLRNNRANARITNKSFLKWISNYIPEGIYYGKPTTGGLVFEVKNGG